MAAYYQRSADAGPTADASLTADPAASRYQVHTTTDPGVFIVEVDAVVNAPAGTTTVSLVQIFRVRDGKIALLRDYFAPEIVD
jgi:limonene-1,2-epoxide hydrolase